MNANDNLERRLADFYESEAPQRAPERVLEGALAITEITTQRRAVFRLPWRFPIMNSYAKMAIAAVAVIAIGAVGLAVLQPGSSPGVGGPSSAGPSIEPISSPNPPLTQTFTSDIHGISVSYPEDWVTIPATGPEPTAEPGFLNPGADFIHDPTLRDHLFIALGSEALDGQAGEDWATAMMNDPVLGCDGELQRQSITVDGAPGLICGTLALAWVDDRGYAIRLHVSPDDPSVRDVYDRTWFDDVLATVQLNPGDATAP